MSNGSLVCPPEVRAEMGAAAMGALIDGLAMLAFAPGGVDFLGVHFEAEIDP